jgi:2-dehydropantoate 2-reductase
MNYIFFGAGAIGTYIGGSLALAGHKVSFIERPDIAAILKRRGLRLTIQAETRSVTPVSVYPSAHEALQQQQADVMVFALKSFDTGPAVDSLANLREKLPAALCLQNGVENESALEKAFGAGQVIAGTVTSAVGRGDAGEIQLERSRGVGIAAGHPLSKAIASSLRQANIRTALCSDPLSMKWSKLLTNLLANASSAILGMTPVEVYGHPGLFEMERAMLRECLQVMRALQLKVIALPGTPVPWLGFGVDYLPARLAQPLLLRVVGGGRGGKMPSFALDLQAGRGKTEVRWLNGAVARFGKQAGVSTPVNEALTEILEGLATGAVDQSIYHQNPNALLARITHA